jgi:hypothetical protein
VGLPIRNPSESMRMGMGDAIRMDELEQLAVDLNGHTIHLSHGEGGTLT